MESLIGKLLLMVLSAGVGLLGFHIKQDIVKIQRLEERLAEYITEEECRRIIKDHIDPLRDDIRRIDKKLDQILQLHLRKFE